MAPGDVVCTVAEESSKWMFAGAVVPLESVTYSRSARNAHPFHRSRLRCSHRHRAARYSAMRPFVPISLRNIRAPNGGAER